MTFDEQNVDNLNNEGEGREGGAEPGERTPEPPSGDEPSREDGLVLDEWGGEVSSFLRSDPAPLSPTEFPTEVLPEPLKRLVQDGARAVGVPEDLVAVPALSLIGGVIGPNCFLEMKPGYLVRPGIWTAVVAQSGRGKTPALNLARKPISELQQRLSTSTTPGNWSWPERLFTTDTTFEALVRLLDNGNSLTVIHDELTGWIAGFNQYRGGRGADRQHYLSLWSSTELTIDRVGGGPSGAVAIHLPCPIVSITGGVQPGMRHKLADEAGLDDGLLSRVLFSWPDAPVSEWVEDGISDALVEAVTDELDKLRMVQHEDPIRLDAAAKRDWVDFFNWAQRAASEVEGPMMPVILKMPDQVARIALVLHCLKHPEDPTAVELDLDTMRGALELGDYFLEHTARVFHGLDSMGGLVGRVRELLEQAPGPVSRSELTKALKNHVKAEQLTSALEFLERRGLVRRERRSSGEGGGRPAETWEWIHERRKE